MGLKREKENKIENRIENKAENKIENRKKYKKIPIWVTLLMLLALVSICLVLTTWVKKTTKEYTSKDKFVRYSMGSKFQYDSNLVLKRENEKTYIDIDGNIESDANIESDGTPIIYEGQSKYLLPVSMAYLNPNADTGAKRVNYFSTMTYDTEQGKISVSYNDKEADMDAGFLYDGNGTFIFIEEVELMVGSMKYTLSPMSYVRLFYKDSVEAFDVKEDNYIYYVFEENEEVMATTKSGYRVNLGTNILTVNDVPRILFSNIEAMGVFE